MSQPAPAPVPPPEPRHEKSHKWVKIVIVIIVVVIAFYVLAGLLTGLCQEKDEEGKTKKTDSPFCKVANAIGDTAKFIGDNLKWIGLGFLLIGVLDGVATIAVALRGGGKGPVKPTDIPPEPVTGATEPEPVTTEPEPTGETTEPEPTETEPEPTETGPETTVEALGMSRKGATLGYRPFIPPAPMSKFGQSKMC